MDLFDPELVGRLANIAAVPAVIALHYWTFGRVVMAFDRAHATQAGQAIVEAAFVVPLLLLIILGAFELFRLADHKLAVDRAAAVMAEFVSDHPDSAAEQDAGAYVIAASSGWTDGLWQYEVIPSGALLEGQLFVVRWGADWHPAATRGIFGNRHIVSEVPGYVRTGTE